MKDKVHELKTLEDVLGAVTPQNIDCFLVDFAGWLRFTVEIDKVNAAVGETVLLNENRGTFKWIDDGKNDVTIKLVDGGSAKSE